MHDGGPHHGFGSPDDANIAGTSISANSEDPAESSPDESEWGCVFIEPYTWPAGFPPFCGRPVLAGSPYCQAHTARCAAPAEASR
jgi:hypothetical protein